MPTSERDRLEVYSGWDYNVPEDTVLVDAFNRPAARETLVVPPIGGDSMLFPGIHFRFFSGPAVTYPGTFEWTPMGARPIGEGRGFLTNQITLTPTSPAARGFTNPITLVAYERATIVLVDGTGHDSVPFFIDPSVTRPTIAAWTESGAVRLRARCGQSPTVDEFDIDRLVGTSGDVLDLTGGCSSYWRVAAVHFGSGNRVLHVRIGASTSASRVYDLTVGTEVVGTAGELAYVQRVMRHASWRFYGATGGTHIIRSWTTLNGNCQAHVCFRNRATCTPSAIMHTSGGTPSLTVDICRNIAGFSTANVDEATVDSLTMMHEFGHLLTTNGAGNQLGDEYWESNDVARICGVSGFTIARCGHSMMADHQFWRHMGSLCTPNTHGRFTQVFSQTVSGAAPMIMGGRGVAGGTSAATTVTECWNNEVNYAGTYGSPAWQVLANTGAAPRPHPSWSPDNHEYVNFANGTSSIIGRTW